MLEIGQNYPGEYTVKGTIYPFEGRVWWDSTWLSRLAFQMTADFPSWHKKPGETESY